MIFAAIQELIKGPEENTGLSSAILPPETQVLDVGKKGRGNRKSLKKLKATVGIDSEQALVNSIINLPQHNFQESKVAYW